MHRDTAPDARECVDIVSCHHHIREKIEAGDLVLIFESMFAHGDLVRLVNFTFSAVIMHGG